MFTNFLYEYISRDKRCLLGLIPDKNDFAKLISPLNENTLFPKTSLNSNINYWIEKSNIINNENVKISESECFASNDDRYDWKIESSLNILGRYSSIGNNFTFLTRIKINSERNW